MQEHKHNVKSSAKPRLMFLVNTLAIGGAEMQVVRLCKHLQVRGWNPYVVSLLPLGGLSEDSRAMESG